MQLLANFALFPLVLLTHLVGTDRIAVMYSVGSKSHFFGLKPAVELLAERGHDITVFTPFKGIASNIKHVREVHLEEIEKIINAEMHIDWFSMQQMKTMLRNTEFRQMVAERNVDLFLVDAYSNEFFYPIADLLRVPLITHLSGSPLPMLLAALGGPVDYASVPSPFTGFDDNMGFYERLQNTLISEFVYFMRKHLMFRKLDVAVRNEFPNATAIALAEKTISLTIVNSHAVTTFPRPLPPAVIPIGALHTRPPMSLPEDVNDFAEEAEHGFIVFSLGSFVPMSSMPNETFQVFANVFAKLPQRIFWKWEIEIPEGMSPNVFMANWIPQQDLLGHRNARLFITHGGLLGTQEAIYHGIPLLSLPFGNDQRGNVVKARRDGYAIQLEWQNLDETVLFDALTHLLNNSSVRKNAARASKLVRDEVVPGKELAVYWIEYVLRHRGTRHLQLASKDLPFYKTYLLDVIGFLLAICAIWFYIAYQLVYLVVIKRRNNLVIQRRKPKKN